MKEIPLVLIKICRKSINTKKHLGSDSHFESFARAAKTKKPFTAFT